jgi:hypothetical protein
VVDVDVAGFDAGSVAGGKAIAGDVAGGNAISVVAIAGTVVFVEGSELARCKTGRGMS